MEIANNQSLSLTIADSSIVGEARRAAANLAERAGLEQRARDNVAVVITEAVKNVLKHAKTGELILQVSPGGDVDALVLDKGPGMTDPGRCMQDGYSTGGTSGIGLGSMARLSSKFDIHSASGVGTAVFCRFTPAAKASTAATGLSEVGVLNIAKKGERVCGDGWAVLTTSTQARVMVADGLGHGPMASEAAREAERIFAEQPADKSPEELIALMHDALRKTRGAAVAVAQLDREQRTVRFAGVGNVSAVILSPDGTPKNMVSHNGTVGFEMRKLQHFQYPWPPGSLVLFYSDGLVSHVRLERYNGLLNRHPMLIAGVMYRDFSRQRDDVTTVVLK
jgi:anti-sigma regulatory factor (Ser/Thr protein kinase)